MIQLCFELRNNFITDILFSFSESRLFDNVSTLKNENLQLTLLNERIRFSSTDSVLNSGGLYFSFPFLLEMANERLLTMLIIDYLSKISSVILV